MQRHSWWSITINNPTDEHFTALQSPVKYVKEMWYQQEVGAQGTPHIQGCINTSQVRFSTLKEWLPTAHIEAARNKDALIRYCKKSETSVEGTFTHWSQRPSNSIDDPEEVIAPATNFLLDEILLFIASCLTMEEFQEYFTDPKTLYDMGVNRLARLMPTYIDKFCRQNVQSAWRVVYTTFFTISRQIQEMDIEEEVSQPVSQEYMFEDCPVCNLPVTDCDCEE